MNKSANIRFRVDPRLVPMEKAARRLHLSLSDFQRVLPNLRARGFPRPDPDIGYFDLKAIDAWLDGQMGLGGEPKVIDATADRGLISERLAKMRLELEASRKRRHS